ncbi:MAG: EamA family transporter [Clostridia bacterium]
MKNYNLFSGQCVMYMKFIPIALVVLSSVCYHVSQKSTPSGLNPIVALIVTYVTASVVSILSYFVFVPKSDLVGLLEAIKNANWASLLLGFAVVGLELGFLLAYRAGWNISIAGLLSNTLVALMLIPVGLLLFKETISLTSVIGVVICITGLIFVSR